VHHGYTLDIKEEEDRMFWIDITRAEIENVLLQNGMQIDK
jgi:hypothetical protein